MNLEHYRTFDVDDFILDPDFKRAALNSIATGNNRLIRRLIRKYPAKELAIQEAVKTVHSLHQHYQNQLPTAEERAEVFRRIQAVHQTQKTTAAALVPIGKVFKWAVAAAAVIGLSVFVVHYFTASFTHKTDYAQVSEYRLPDGSKVVLNANSALKVSGQWQGQSIREVWLDGEAFFEVRSIQDQARRFIVHTNGPDIEVTGTSFNVHTRISGTQIFLEEGRIELHFDREDGSNAQSLVMAPGEWISFSPDNSYNLRENAEPTAQRSWMDGYLIIDDLPVQEIISRIENHYGMTVVLEDDSLFDKRFEGTLPTRNLSELIETMETLFSTKITRKENLLLIK